MEIRYLTPLTAAEQAGWGVPAPFPLAMADRVRYADLDTNNHVNNKAYLSWFETTRLEYFQRVCVPRWPDAPPRTVIRGIDMRFVQEILPGESYMSAIRVTRYRRTSFTFEQQIWSHSLRATAFVTTVLLTPDGEARFPIPRDLIEVFASTDGAQHDAG